MLEVELLLASAQLPDIRTASLWVERLLRDGGAQVRRHRAPATQGELTAEEKARRVKYEARLRLGRGAASAPTHLSPHADLFGPPGHPNPSNPGLCWMMLPALSSNASCTLVSSMNGSL
jgi:hypothetical protein